MVWLKELWDAKMTPPLTLGPSICIEALKKPQVSFLIYCFSWLYGYGGENQLLQVLQLINMARGRSKIVATSRDALKLCKKSTSTTKFDGLG